MAKERNFEIDYLKGIAIIFVLIMHSLENTFLRGIRQEVYLGQAVPIFFTVSFFLAFNKFTKQKNDKLTNLQVIKDWFAKKRIVNLIKKIMLPFVVIFLMQIIVFLIFGRNDRVVTILKVGGWGPGSYYPWEYLQIWMLCPFLFVVLDRKTKYGGELILLSICVVLNIVCSLIKPIDRLYSILCIRHLFLAAIAYIWLKNKGYNKIILITLGTLSLIYLEFFRRTDLQPFIYNGAWNAQQYPTYFWTLLFIGGLITIHKRTKLFKWNKVIYWLGTNSWEVFLLQMMIVGFLPFSHFHLTNIFAIDQIIYILIIFLSSILPVTVYRWIIGGIKVF